MTATPEQATRLLASILLSLDKVETDLRTYAETLTELEVDDLMQATSRPSLLFLAMAGQKVSAATAAIGTVFMATQDDMRDIGTGFIVAGVLVRAQLVAAGEVDEP